MTLENLSAKVDLFYATREQRLLMQRQVDRIQEQESKLKEELIRELQASKVSSIGGTLARVTIQEKIKPIAQDWAKVHAYMKENDAFDLMQRRLTEAAVKSRWEDGIIIPGVDRFIVFDLSVAKP
jgi:acetyl-CoA carboxylase alpha subunit